MYRPAWRMNHTGVASAGCSRQALMNRVAASVSVHLEQRACEAHQIFEPHRFEAELGAERAKLVRNRVVQKVVARDDGDGRVALLFVSPEAAQEAETIDERHPEVEDDRVGAAALCFAQAHLGAERRMDMVAFEAKHPREGGGDSFVVVDDKYCA